RLGVTRSVCRGRNCVSRLLEQTANFNLLLPIAERRRRSCFFQPRSSLLQLAKPRVSESEKSPIDRISLLCLMHLYRRLELTDGFAVQTNAIQRCAARVANGIVVGFFLQSQVGQLQQCRGAARRLRMNTTDPY